MPPRTAFVPLTWVASVVGVVMIVGYIILKVAGAQIGNVELLLWLGIVLVVGGLAGGVWVTRGGS